MKVLGIMSGSSMDGIDLALCDVDNNAGSWSVKIIKGVTIPMNETWRVRLSQVKYQNPEVYAKTDVFFGRYLGELALAFEQETGQKIDLVASHGHTVFHDPNGWVTAQIGDGATIYGVSKIPTVTNFRRADVAAGGQGAPLVTVGDELLFAEYDACINLGGFCNASIKGQDGRTSFDIVPCNILLNRLARERKQKFDKDGEIGENGQIIYPLLEKLNAIPYYKSPAPKSLGRDWINKELWHVVRDFDKEPVEDRMKTIIMHISTQIAIALDRYASKPVEELKILLTGGGTWNKTLVDFISTETDADIIIPDTDIVDFKEAMVFALLGAMRVNGETNVNTESTGASFPIVAGSLDGVIKN